jgi:hypothetical protein
VDIFVAAFVVAREEQEKVADQKTPVLLKRFPNNPDRALMRKLVQPRSETLKRFIQTNSRNSAASLSQLREYFEVRFRLSVPILTGRCQLSLQLLSTDFQ